MEKTFKQDKTNATFELAFTPAEFETAQEEAYKTEGKKYRVHGFRAGKAPRKMIEQTYGGGVFIEPAIDNLFRKGYKEVLEAYPDFEPIAPPELDFDMPESGGVILKGTVETIPQFKLGKYTGIEVKKTEIKITDKEVDGFIEKQRTDRARKVDAPEGHKIKKGDTANINFLGTIDGVAFNGGTAEGFDLEIGSNSFIDTFEDQLIGLTVGAEKDVVVTFPKQYHSKDLAGKPANFAVKINKISQTEIPALDDKFVTDVSEFKTVAEYRADTKEKLEKSAEIEATQANEDNIISAIVKETKLDIPEKMVERQLDMMMDNINRRLSMQGFNLELFAQMQGTTVDAIREQHRETAINTIKTRLVMDEIAKVEKIKPTDAEIEELIAQAADRSSRKDKDIRKDAEVMQMLTQNKTYDKITEFLKTKNLLK